MSRTNGIIVSSTSSATWMTRSSPSSSTRSSASVTSTATSISASRARSRPVISQSIHTKASVMEAEAIRRWLRWVVYVHAGELEEAIMAAELLTQAAIDAALTALHPGWTGTTEQLARSIEFADFPTAVQFVNRLAPRCEEMDHHPDLALRWRWVEVALSTHSAGGVTGLDVTLAGIVDEVAGTLPLAD